MAEIYNNPGNIQIGQGFAGTVGEYASDREGEGKKPFVEFDSPQMGLRAIYRDLQSKVNTFDGDVAKIISKYAPGNENKTQAYIDNVIKQIGSDTITADNIDEAVRAIVRHENGTNSETTKYYLDDPNLLKEAKELAKHNMPAAMTYKKAAETYLPKKEIVTEAPTVKQAPSINPFEQYMRGAETESQYGKGTEKRSNLSNYEKAQNMVASTDLSGIYPNQNLPNAPRNLGTVELPPDQTITPYRETIKEDVTVRPDQIRTTETIGVTAPRYSIGEQQERARRSMMHGNRQDRMEDYQVNREYQEDYPYLYPRNTGSYALPQQQAAQRMMGGGMGYAQGGAVNQAQNMSSSNQSNNPGMSLAPPAPNQAAQGLASLGRGGDSTLVHMQPQEVAGLQQLAQANGTSLTTNPMTGYPEAFQMGGLFKGAATLAAGYFTGGAALAAGWGAGAATAASIGAGAATGAGLAAATGEDVGAGMISGGLGGMGGGGFATAPAAGIGAAVPAGTSHLGTAGLANIPATTASSMAGTGSLAAPITDTAGATIAPNMGQVNSVASPYAAQTQGGMSGLGYNEPIGDTVLNVGRTPPATGGGWDKGTGQMVDPKDATQEKSWLGGELDAFKHRYPVTEMSDNEFVRTADGMKKKSITRDMTNTEAAMKLGKPIATLGLSGLEESDFYNEPDFSDPRDKYNPYSKLNLNKDTGVSDAMRADTGLRLFAEGGRVEDRVADPGAINLNSRTQGPSGQGLNLGRGVGSLNLNTGAMSQSANARAAAAEAKRKAAAAPSMEFVMGRGMMPVGAIESGPATNYYGNFGGGYTFKGKRYYAEGGRVADPGAINLNSRTQGPSGQGLNLGRGVGSLNLNTGAMGQSANARAAAAAEAKRKAEMPQFKMIGSYNNIQVPADYIDGVGTNYYRDISGKFIRRAEGGLIPAAYAEGGYLQGPGDGMSDNIPANIDGNQQAALSTGEYVVSADVVSSLGNGSSEAGAKRLHAMMDRVRKATTGRKAQATEINPSKYMPA